MLETVAAGQTNQVLGGTGGVGDRIDFLLAVPASTSPGAITITDGINAGIVVFAGGASSLASLVPFPIPIGQPSESGPWKVTTGANIAVVAMGNFGR